MFKVIMIVFVVLAVLAVVVYIAVEMRGALASRRQKKESWERETQRLNDTIGWGS